MTRIMLQGKIHRARVTEARTDYEGSITVDRDLLEAAGILPFEQVHVLDVDNGARFVTYAIAGERASGEMVVNGAAAHLVEVGHPVMVLSYVQLADEEARALEPKIVLVDEANRPVTAATSHHDH